MTLRISLKDLFYTRRLNSYNQIIFLLVLGNNDLFFHLAPPGSSACDIGESVSQKECAAAVKTLFPASDGTFSIVSGGKCLDGGSGQVPLGCSVQLSSLAAVYKSRGNTGKQCIKHDLYQLVCKSSGKLLANI